MKTKWMGVAAGLVVALGLVYQTKALTTIDVTSIGSSGSTASGAIFFGIDPQSTGTGVIDPFLREQQNGSEAGINTSIASPPYDDKTGPWTHDLAVGSLAPTMHNGTAYYQFYLDANQSGNGPVSLIDFRIYVVGGAPFTLSSDLQNLVNNVTPNFSMNTGADTYRVDIAGNSGSGSGDMYVLVPVDAIGTTGNLYMYAAFGQDAAGGGYATTDGFEEWRAVAGQAPPPPSVPDGGTTVLLLGMALAGIASLRRWVSA